MGSRGVAMVIWAGSAIGKAVVLSLVKQGCSKLIVVGETGDELTSIADECRGSGVDEENLLMLTSDFDDPDAIKDSMAQAVKKFGRIDYAANCSPLDFDSSSTTTLNVEKLQVPGQKTERQVWLWMREQVSQALNQDPSDEGWLRMSIVNVATIHGFATEPGRPSYAAASHGIVGMSKATAMDYVKSGIRINCVCHFLVAQAASDTKPAVERDALPAPFGGFITAHEISQSIVFLLGPLSSAITGIVLPVDGGWSLYHF